METLKEAFISYQTNIPIFGFTVNFLLAAFLSIILGWLYCKYSTALSNKTIFAKNFILISTTTMLIISIVKSSLALSLGLVGALSIVRFRTAIKEPEELTYLFFAIAIGLGFGANQTYVTITAFILTGILIIISFYSSGFKIPDKNMFFTIECDNNRQLQIDSITKILAENCSLVKLRRFDTSKNYFEAIFLIQLKEVISLKDIETQVIKLNDKVKISFLDQNSSLG